MEDPLKEDKGKGSTDMFFFPSSFLFCRVCVLSFEIHIYIDIFRTFEID